MDPKLLLQETLQVLSNFPLKNWMHGMGLVMAQKLFLLCKKYELWFANRLDTGVNEISKLQKILRKCFNHVLDTLSNL